MPGPHEASGTVWAQRLLLVNLALAFYSVGTVWLVQLSSYPLWRHVGLKEFHNYHLAWWHSIWLPVLFPAFLAFAGAVAALWLRPPHVPAWAVWLGVLLQGAWVMGTAIWWGPRMAQIGRTLGEFPADLFQGLLRTHWLRVAFITAYALLVFWMALVSFPE
jgi:hypothetical protein